MKKTVGVKEIAIEAEVSIGTVDRVLHNRPGVAKKTKEKVLKAIEKLGYSPNILAGVLSRKKIYKLVCLIPDPKEISFWKQVDEGILKAKEELKLFQVKIIQHYFSFNLDNFSEQSQKVLEEQPDGVVFLAQLSEKQMQFASALDKENISYVTINTLNQNLNYKSYIGQDAYAAGRLAGKLIDLGRKKGKILIVNIFSHTSHSLFRMRRISGFCEYLSEVGRSKDIALFEMNISNKELFRDSLERLIIQDNIEAIFVTNSKSYILFDAVAPNFLDKIMVVGFDLVKENINLLQEGKISFLISQQAKNQGYRGVLQLFDVVVKKKEVETCIYLPIDIVCKENFSYYDQ